MSKILVVVDMQKDFTYGALGNSECVKAINSIKEIMESSSYDEVIFTRDTHSKDYLNTQEGRKLPVEHCLMGSDGWEVADELTVTAKKVFSPEAVSYIDKPSFGSLEFANMLHDKYKDGKDLELDFVGVCTGICVISNVALAKAACPEAKVCVIEKACACVTPDTHKTAIDAMKTFQVDVI